MNSVIKSKGGKKYRSTFLPNAKTEKSTIRSTKRHRKTRAPCGRDWQLRLRILTSGLGDSSSTRGILRTNEVLKVHRASTITPVLEGCEVEVHNGRRNVRVKITPERFGHRFGEFVATSSWALNTSKKTETTRKEPSKNPKSGGNKK